APPASSPSSPSISLPRSTPSSAALKPPESRSLGRVGASGSPHLLAIDLVEGDDGTRRNATGVIAATPPGKTMTRKSRLSAPLFAAFVGVIAGAVVAPARADEGASGSYTLFNPVPADQLRQMSTDRPNITNSPQTVDAGHVQIEQGFLDYARGSSDKL